MSEEPYLEAMELEQAKPGKNGWVTIDDGEEVEIDKSYLKLLDPKEQPKQSPQAEGKPLTPKEIVEKFKESLPPQTGQQITPQMIEQMMNLVMQMGSDQSFLARGQIDERKLANINENDQLALGHFNYRAIVDNIRYYGLFVDWILTSSNAVNGLRARQFIQLMQANAGVPQQEFVQRPGWIGRNLTKRNWEKEAQDKGATIIG